MNFRTQYQPRERVVANPGQREKVLWSPVFDKDGGFELKESGREDLYASIQSHAQSVDIHVILERFARGDVSALSKVQGTYGDFTTVPKTYAELLNSVIQGEQYFLSLPVEVRARFGHDFNKWLVSMDDMPSWLEKMDLMDSEHTSSSTTQSKEQVSSQVPPNTLTS